jgi:hypothetical protein
MPDASPYIEAAYAVFVLLLAIYGGIIALRMRRTARERRALEAELAAQQPAAVATERERVVA